MLLKHLLDLYELLDSPDASGDAVKEFLAPLDSSCSIETYALTSAKGSTDMVRIRIPGSRGKAAGGDAPTIGLLGRLGGLGARPERIGFVSDGDGALVALACASKLMSMHARGDVLAGDVFISTHVCPHAPTMPHKPVPFMGSPVATAAVNKEEVTDELDAILVVDTTKGNRIANTRGFALSPTVKEGVILRVSEDLLDLVEIATGKKPNVFALSLADITPYGNGLYHLNSILQPCTATSAPVVGVAITTETAVPGCATGATHLTDLDEAGTFMIEAAKAFGEGTCAFYDEAEFELFGKRYGSMAHLQTMGALPAENEIA
ncbi:DUF1177 domain-containing protein [Raoultibacter phocaeensis]|uniref:DUF1177 domain-containing protein n=1 Tax=Raoultibacter phocaeensis TaxID=2479841 RepID=UPI00111A2006|nr:DUF1177 domain-containing protein [Raoultibacter phocaeensis]